MDFVLIFICRRYEHRKHVTLLIIILQNCNQMPPKFMMFIFTNFLVSHLRSWTLVVFSSLVLDPPPSPFSEVLATPLVPVYTYIELYVVEVTGLSLQHLNEAKRDRNEWRELTHVITRGRD